MTDYIKREDAIRQIVKESAQNNLHIPSIGSVIYTLIRIKPDDVVEVVRCKDCKNWKKEHLCQAWSRYGTIETKADQFCSYGERAEA